MSMIAYAFLQSRRLAQAGREKKSQVHRHSRACQQSGKPFLITCQGRHRRIALIAESRWKTCQSDFYQSSASLNGLISRAIKPATGHQVANRIGDMPPIRLLPSHPRSGTNSAQGSIHCRWKPSGSDRLERRMNPQSIAPARFSATAVRKNGVTELKAL